MTARADMQTVKAERDAALQALCARVPYIQFLGVSFDRRGDELTGLLRFDDKLIGNPILPALHGGVTASFLEITAIVDLAWRRALDVMDAGEVAAGDIAAPGALKMPKTINFTVDYLRSGRARDCYARARINRSGRRYASVQVAAWQDNRDKLFAQGVGHFLMPQRDGD